VSDLAVRVPSSGAATDGFGAQTGGYLSSRLVGPLLSITCRAEAEWAAPVAREIPLAGETATLLEAARLGDQAAWDALVARFNGLVWSIARGYRLDVADAHDAVQMTWLRLVENLNRISDPERLAAWLATTARRECLQLLRKARRDRPAALESALSDIADPAAPVDAAMLLDERDRALWRALASISERCQRLLRVLMASPPPTYKEVAAALDMSIGTIGPARQRCLGQLRQVVLADESMAGQLGGDVS
jgi:RNA polymerase sigma factor (sigma-70 family)